MTSCAVCDNPVYCRGWCNKHYRRWKKYGDPEGGRYRFHGASMEEAFRWHMPGDPPAGGDCWEWSSSRNQYGYGQIGVGDKIPGAHVVAYEIFVGPVPNGKLVRHVCDNPPCVSPRHLLVGTHQDNSDDKVARARQVRGQAIPWTHLADTDVIDIRTRHAHGETQVSLARMFGVSQSRISAITRQESWKHVASPSG